jgi:3'-phosphoadenosine 5'-phosphosulfate sulfotransferase (PAPS reductase)/FAD synthetase
VKNIQHLINVSGGKDSTAVYLLAIESGRPFRAVFADTGNEHEVTYEFVSTLHEKTGGPKVEWVRADFTERLAKHKQFILDKWPAELMAGREGRWQWMPRRETETPRPESEPAPPKNIYRSATVRCDGGSWRWLLARKPMSEADARSRAAEAASVNEPSGNTYLDMCIWKGFFPGRTRQFCTEELKTTPIIEQVVLPMLKRGPVLQWLGIRALESAPRSKQPRFNHHECGCMVWRPIFRYTLADVWALHLKHGILPNPLYAEGFERVGCFLCINCKKGEVRRAAEFGPEHIEKIRNWEHRVMLASKYREATFFPAMTDPTDSDRRGHGEYAGIDSIVEWSKTSRGGRQFDMFFEQQSGGGCSSDLGLCET